MSFVLRKGETLALVGESGSGKTTVGRCLLRLIEPTSGQIIFDGVDLAKLNKPALRRLRSKIKIVFQEPYDSLNPRMTIRNSLSDPLRVLGLSTAERDRRIDQLIEQVRLEPQYLTRYPHELSSGQLQMIGVARAMATSPQFIVLDEPTSLLDPTIRADIIELLISVQQETGISYLFISHDLTTARYISKTVAVMYLGKIVEVASTEEIFENPMHPYTRSLLSSVLYPEPTLERHTIPLRGEIPSPIDLPSGCFLHSRCPLAVDACSKITPQLVDIGANHLVSCIRLAPLPEQIIEDGQVLTPSEAKERFAGGKGGAHAGPEFTSAAAPAEAVQVQKRRIMDEA